MDNAVSGDEINELSKKLVAVAEQDRIYKKAKSRLDFIRSRFEEERQRKVVLEQELEKEKNDYDRMERSSLKRLFHVILQNVKKQTEKERQEYLAVLLKWEQCCDEINKLEREEIEKKNEFKGLEDISVLYADLYAKKEIYMLQQMGGPLFSNGEMLAVANSQLNEIEEAKEVGHSLMSQLNLVNSHLKSASNWGTWDLFGGGILATMAKRGNMDRAKEAMQEAQHLLHNFNKELGDISVEQFNFQFGDGFTAFADYFFDGLIIDWLVQSSINKAFNVTQELFTKVENTCNELDSKANKLALYKEEIMTERKNLIESVGN